MAKHSMNINVSKVPNNPDMFDFTITTPTLRSQFRIPREMVNKLRVLIEKVLITKGSSEPPFPQKKDPID